MPREYKPRERVPRTANLEALLRGLQNDIELFGDEHVKQRRRVLLKGFRAGLWAVADKPAMRDVAQTLRAELFGHALPAMVDEDDIRCHPGTTDEVTSDDR